MTEAVRFGHFENGEYVPDASLDCIFRDMGGIG